MARRQRKRWRVAPAQPSEAARLAGALGCSLPAAQLLLNRGITTPEEADSFLHPSLDHLPDPFLLPDAEAAAERLKQALHKREKIAIHGDYDGDGVTSAALWMRLLEKLGADVSVHVPHRKRDGYDMRSKFVAQAKADGVSLILTTDCGIQRCEEVEEAREAGIDVIVTDHHEPGDTLPKAVAVVNPHRRDSRYPYPCLAGVGVAFRAGEALVRHLAMPVASYRKHYIDLAAIGTVTDVMPLTGDNRVIVKHGLEALRTTRKHGLRALLASAGLDGKPLTAHNIGWIVGPRLNAIGRVDDSRLALDLLLTKDPVEAATLAARIEQANQERRQEQDRILADVLQQVANKDILSTGCLVVSGPSWHAGVIGIVASRLVNQFNRPAILIAIDEETGRGKGSARSIRAFDIFQAITSCGSHLLEFGGHSHAAGLSLEISQISSFAEAMNEIATSTLTEEDFQPAIQADLEIDPSEVNLALLRELAMFEPWGSANEEPVFISRGVRITDSKRIGKEQQHLKLMLKTEGRYPLPALWWQSGDLADHLHPGDAIDLCYRAQLNLFNGSTTVQLCVEDLRPADVEEW